jgi:hypothetical protein
VKPPRAEERFAVSADIAHREINGRLLLLLPGDSHLYAFNDPGRLIWRAVLRKRSRGQIAATIAKTFRIPLARAERDVGELLADLLRRGAIRRI